MSRVAIIGGGASGFAVARAILAEPVGFEVTIFDKQESYGGLWHYVKDGGPMYRSLESNVPRQLMGFADRPFRDSAKSYMDRREVEEYLQNYCSEIASHPRITVHLGTEVRNVDKDASTNEWTVDYGADNQYRSDFILIATGHYHYPIWPDIEDLHSHPGLSHSLHYDNPEEFKDLKVLIIGNATSGSDLAIQILSKTSALTISRKRELPSDILFENDGGETVVWKPAAERVIGKTVRFTDGTEAEFDRIIACTGYSYRFPYLKYDGEPSLPIQHPSHARIRNFYKHTFYSGDERLATVGMNRYMVPFPTFETQGAVIAGVWAGRLSLPPIEERIAYEEQVLSIKGDNTTFHGLPMEEDLVFMQDLWDWAESSPGGFKAERWSAEKLQLRQAVQELKMVDNIEKLAASKHARLVHKIEVPTRESKQRLESPVVRESETLAVA